MSYVWKTSHQTQQPATDKKSFHTEVEYNQNFNTGSIFYRYLYVTDVK